MESEVATKQITVERFSVVSANHLPRWYERLRHKLVIQKTRHSLRFKMESRHLANGVLEHWKRHNPIYLVDIPTSTYPFG